MRVISGFGALEAPSDRPGIVTIGNFDGVHRGHQAILQNCLQQARGSGARSIVYTFNPHPRSILRRDSTLSLLLTYEEKRERIQRLGPEWLVEEPFTEEFSKISAEDFFSEVLMKTLKAKSIVVGYDFRFGYGRMGELDQLERFCRARGVVLTIVPPQQFLVGTQNTIASSTVIREFLGSGNLAGAKDLLGYDFFYRGQVVKGDQRGSKMGFPTANVRLQNKLVLPHGVYATRAWSEGVPHPAVTNIGVRPTFGGGEALIETHFLDTSLDLYGKTIEVSFVSPLRGERKFSSIDDLKRQIADDIHHAREVLDIRRLP